MDLLSFVRRNDLWYLDTPEYYDKFTIGRNLLTIVERGFVEILEELSSGVFTYLNLEFHYQPIYPYDALIIREGTNYKCISLLGRDRVSSVWFPEYVHQAMENTYNPKNIYIKIGSVKV